MLSYTVRGKVVAAKRVTANPWGGVFAKMNAQSQQHLRGRGTDFVVPDAAVKYDSAASKFQLETGKAVANLSDADYAFLKAVAQEYRRGPGAGYDFPDTPVNFDGASGQSRHALAEGARRDRGA